MMLVPRDLHRKVHHTGGFAHYRHATGDVRAYPSKCSSMSTTEIIKPGPAINDGDVAAFEERIATRLSRPYRTFLKAHNGGVPEPPYFGKERIPSVLQILYGLRAKKKMNDLAANYRRMRSTRPREVIPITVDTFGNEICLAIKGKKCGKVYLWDNEGASEKIDPRVEFPWLDLGDDYEFKGDDWPGHPDLSLIADSFAKFLDSFHDFDDDETQAKPAKATPKPSKAKPATKQPAKKPRKSPKA
jgi:hypothetical protein